MGCVPSQHETSLYCGDGPENGIQAISYCRRTEKISNLITSNPASVSAIRVALPPGVSTSSSLDLIGKTGFDNLLTTKGDLEKESYENPLMGNILEEETRFQKGSVRRRSPSPHKDKNIHVAGEKNHEKHHHWHFPIWRSHRKCDYCHNHHGKDNQLKESREMEDFCHRCATIHNVKNNHRQAANRAAGEMVLANFLAMNALELTAPASDALLKNRKNQWVQLAGHPGAFAPAGPNTIWKKRLTKDNNETQAYEAIMKDVACMVVPKFYREVAFKGEYFIEMEDLLQHFRDPSIMDIKMGSRTFLESEVKNPVLRKDMYEKMVKLAPDEPTADEHEQKAVTKLRYMQFREKGSSTDKLGFRIEAIRMSGQPVETDLKRIKEREEVAMVITKFLDGEKSVRDKLLQRLRDIRQRFESSPFFSTHEVIGNSLLIMYDHDGNADAWMIDFAKTMLVDRKLNHRTAWSLGNHEDGYLYGIDNLIKILEECQMDLRPHPTFNTAEKPKS